MEKRFLGLVCSREQRRCYKDKVLVFFLFILVTSCCAISSTTFHFEVSRFLYREGVNHRQGVMCLPASIQPGHCWATPSASSSWEHSHSVTCLARGSAAESETKMCLPPLVVVISDSYVVVQKQLCSPRVPALLCRERGALGRRSAPLHFLLWILQCRGVPRGRDGVTFA